MCIVCVCVCVFVFVCVCVRVCVYYVHCVDEAKSIVHNVEKSAVCRAEPGCII